MMELIRGLHNLRANPEACVATIGNFDGVHLGHQQVLQRVKELAHQYQLPSTVITFEPQPLEFFLQDKAPARLTRLREKIIYLQQYGIERVVILPFNAEFAALSPAEFIHQILLNSLAVKHLIIGDDFHFGKNRQGSLQDLLKAGLNVETVGSCLLAAQRVSSTAIRQALEAGDLASTQRMLGRDYAMCGRVAHGNKRGRIIGFPTANLYLHRQVTPIKGVFCVSVEGLSNGKVMGVANVGNRPTVDGSRTLLEVHLFNFDRDIYGQYITVNFLHKLRDERKFADFERLKQQILLDADNARAFFNKGVNDDDN